MKKYSFILSKFSLIIIFINLIGIIYLVLIEEYLGPVFLAIVIVTIVIRESNEKLRKNNRLEELEKKIKSISYQVKKAGNYAINNLPIGVIVYDQDKSIEWYSHYVKKIFGRNVGKKDINTVCEDIGNKIDTRTKFIIDVDERKYEVTNIINDRVLYLIDVTELEIIKERYEDNLFSLGFIYIDNFDEVVNEMSEQEKTAILGSVNQLISDWAEKHGIIIKSISLSRFIMICSNKILNNLMDEGFVVIDKVRETGQFSDIALSLSIGIACDDDYLVVSEKAQEAIDFTQSRGGDQACVIYRHETPKIYGGKMSPIAKKTRVRSRVVSHKLAALIDETDLVFIMGHKYPDPDSFGSALGILKIVESMQRKGYIVIDQEELDNTMSKIIKYLSEEDEGILTRLISPKEIDEYYEENSLMIIVDVQSPEHVVDKDILERDVKKVIIDHHKRGHNYIEDPDLIYAEPYSSSTVELVSEIIQYFPFDINLAKTEATIMLAGIIVDTNSFTHRTSSRTFDAASYLRSQGADTIKMSMILRDSIEEHKVRAQLIDKALLINGKFAVVKAPRNKEFTQVQLAQVADALLNIDEVTASFVLGYVSETMVKISARSIGDFNVQLLIEKLGGGGHHNNAACVFEDEDIEEVYKKLSDLLEDINEGDVNDESDSSE